MKAWLVKHYPDASEADTNELRVPLPKDAVFAFSGHICSPAHSCDRDEVDSKDASCVSLSASCVWGYSRCVSYLKKRGLTKINEGKHQLKTIGYELLELKLMTIAPTKKGQSWATVLFGWSYFVLMWNLMSRSESVDGIMLQHIEWIDDALVIEEQGHKGDQTGAEKFCKHVYANSLAKLKDRYIHFGERAGQLCGRMITGLPFHSEQFGALFLFFLGSVIHHEQYLRATLSPTHPIFNARAFSSNQRLTAIFANTFLFEESARLAIARELGAMAKARAVASTSSFFPRDRGSCSQLFCQI
ncbi:hypothetical protein PHMEG_0008431 [Phytophthora megakarya]|uniref:Uncharacterized protein n=1 Tax=Phytophthora megakarya TaxID=4795 RepID=A0A225WK37_9STRA|nr:hypothetical protein PHMEG_0008431 [Phytophthora megakarya]